MYKPWEGSCQAGKNKGHRPGNFTKTTLGSFLLADVTTARHPAAPVGGFSFGKTCTRGAAAGACGLPALARRVAAVCAS